MALRDYLNEQLLGIVASYQSTGVVHHIGVVYPKRNNQLQIFIPRGHALALGSLVTVHLDNRTGIDELDAELRVYRTSYKGRVLAAEDNWVLLEPLEYALIHGVKVVDGFTAPGYAFPADSRPERALPLSPLHSIPPVEPKDNDNKVGVLTTLAQGQPHTTVLAFLSTAQDDVFLISMPDSFKVQQLRRDPRCFFTIDERAKFTFEQSIEWNYTIMEMQAHQVPASCPLFEQVRRSFILKNPWEVGFFLSPALEMFHLQRVSLVCSGQAVARQQGESR
ncbi:MAG: pyridoxamine 5'-phosphate oxidase family protein [Simplicispira sp.]|uniref:pyridoxamine 5'-phosphate oxidase family protein n=1 Tax=Simplicispira sp. TaxID=2015802 RepID=UPI0025863358|nr:pyridoxamine 5'-phosphate oxidase family protein [Simplicispira sp.]MDD2692427.1 pyridoxamine 5'-phosphate oxidase family protein [Simplicispira sp.]